MYAAVTALPPDQPALRLTVERSGERTVVGVAGELDIATADQFATGLREELASRPVLLELSELAFVDSSGLRAIDALLEAVDREGWTLRIGPDLAPGVRQVLEMTGMIELLPIENAPGSAGDLR
ncbi:MAG TPA: STAS domain-containing protein [Solirubrobacteraceae bacterium]